MMKRQLTTAEKQNMLTLARKSIVAFFEYNRKRNMREVTRSDISRFTDQITVTLSDLQTPLLLEKSCSFVTLFKTSDETGDDILQGCIGSLEPARGENLFQNIVHNSIMAAFFDYRFSPLEEEDLSEIKIEISILSPMEDISFETKEGLINQIKDKGVVLNHQVGSATFLPQVWDHFPDAEIFLEQLAKKAGLRASEVLEATYQIYDVMLFSENDQNQNPA